MPGKFCMRDVILSSASSFQLRTGFMPYMFYRAYSLQCHLKMEVCKTSPPLHSLLAICQQYPAFRYNGCAAWTEDPGLDLLLLKIDTACCTPEEGAQLVIECLKNLKKTPEMPLDDPIFLMSG